MIKKFKIENPQSTKAFLMLFIIIEHGTRNVCREMRPGGGGVKLGRPGANSLLLFFLVLLVQSQDQHELPEERNKI